MTRGAPGDHRAPRRRGDRTARGPAERSPRPNVAAIAAALALLGATARAPEARADPGETDPASAEVLFRSARALLEAGDVAKACPKFEASLALDPSASTMLNLAKCHERQGKLATAWSDYQSALALSRETRGAERRRAIEALAKESAAALEPRLPKVRVVVGAPPPGLTLERDGRELPAAVIGEALPVDPGAHVFRVRAPGFAEQQRSLTLAEAQAETLTFSLVPARPSPATGRAAQDRAAPEAPRAPVPTWVWVTGGVGVALIGASVPFLLGDLSAIHALTTKCHTTNGVTTCDEGYDYAADNARKNRGFGLFVGLSAAGVIAVSVASIGLAHRPARKAGTAARLELAPLAGPSVLGAVLKGGF